MNYNGKYLYVPAEHNDKLVFVDYKGGADTENWLNFCYDYVAPNSRLIDIVSTDNFEIPRAFNCVDIIVDDEGLFSNGDTPCINIFASFLSGHVLVGDALLGFVAYDADAEGDHVFPFSEHPHFAFLCEFIGKMFDLPFIPDKKED